jgi:hypothetical protein
MRSNPLAIYLNDHFAGATVGVELARRAAANNRGNPYGDVLAEIAKDIERDRESLAEVMDRLSVRSDRLKVAASWVGEKATRLKPNDKLLGYSALSRLEELELLSLGVEGKLALWQALRRTHGGDSRLRGVDLDELIERARSQRRRLERQRRRAAEEALG